MRTMYNTPKHESVWVCSHVSLYCNIYTEFVLYLNSYMCLDVLLQYNNWNHCVRCCRWGSYTICWAVAIDAYIYRYTHTHFFWWEPTVAIHTVVFLLTNLIPLAQQLLSKSAGRPIRNSWKLLPGARLWKSTPLWWLVSFTNLKTQRCDSSQRAFKSAQRAHKPKFK